MEQRRLPAARRADDADPAAAGPVHRRREQLQEPAGLGLAAEEHRGVLGGERTEAWVGRAGRVPGERAFGVEPGPPQARGQPGESGVALVEVDLLEVGHEVEPRAAAHPQREDRLAERTGQRDLANTTGGDGGVGDQATTASVRRSARYSSSSHRCPAADALVGVDVKEDGREALVREVVAGGEHRSRSAWLWPRKSAVSRYGWVWPALWSRRGTGCGCPEVRQD